jgi:allantoinase
LPAFDLIIANGKVVTSGEIFDGTIFIAEGKIAKVSRSTSHQEASWKINANGMLVLPGSIDPHVHFRDPGLTNKEDFETGTKGAAAGGVTTVFDMPTTNPVVIDVSTLENKISAVKGKAHVDFGLYAAAGPENIPEIRAMAKQGAIAFKTYMVAPPPERVKEYQGSFVTNHVELYDVMRAVGQTGLVHSLHAEDNQIVEFLTSELRSSGRRDNLAHHDSRPNFTEAIAIFVATTFAGHIHSRIHIVHLSTNEGLKIIESAKDSGVAVTCETCPQYLLFTKKTLKQRGPLAKYNPPARDKADTIALIRGLADGSVDVLATDHAPHMIGEKQTGLEDIWRAPPGTPGVETKLPILLTYAQAWGISLNRLVQVTASGVAKIFNVADSKGDIRKGLDADLALVNAKEEWVVDPRLLQTKSKETVLYGKMRMRGRVKMTVVRGNVVYEDGVGFGQRGWGKFVRGKPGKQNEFRA